MRGSSLRSRREEPYLRRFLHESAELFIRDSPEAVRERYFATAQQLQSQALPPQDFSRWETVTEKTFRSESNRRLAAAVQGQRIGERVEVYQRRDGSLGGSLPGKGTRMSRICYVACARSRRASLISMTMLRPLITPSLR